MSTIPFMVTGTQLGATIEQLKQFERVVIATKHETFCHGDCIGVDAQAHDIVRRLRRDIGICIHPSNIEDKRAYCVGAKAISPVVHPLKRNQIMVDAADLVIVIPKTHQEQRRSGTWATYRYAIKRGKRVMLIFPDGTVKVETPETLGN